MSPLVLWIGPGLTLTRLAEWLDRGFRIQTSLDEAPDPLTQIADGQPVLIVVMAAVLPKWVAEVRSNPATRRIPVVAIADSTLEIAAARYVGIEQVISSTDAVDAEKVAAYVKVVPTASALADSCAELLSELALKGFHEFNAHEFFECHESLETAWKADSGAARDLYRVILQIGLAYYQIERSNYNGALKMFLRSQQWFAQLPDQCRGVDLAQLRSDAAAARAHLEALGPDRITQFDMTLIKPLRWVTLTV
jgi:hypothetical protein